MFRDDKDAADDTSDALQEAAKSLQQLLWALRGEEHGDQGEEAGCATDEVGSADASSYWEKHCPISSRIRGASGWASVTRASSASSRSAVLVGARQQHDVSKFLEKSEGSQRFLFALEILVGNRDVSESKLQEIRQPLEDMAEQLNVLFEKLHEEGAQPGTFVDVLAETRSLLRQRNSELLRSDAEVSKTVALWQVSQAQLAETRALLQDALAESRKMEARVQRSDEELAQTRLTLQRSRADLQKHIGEVQEIQSQLRHAPRPDCSGAAAC